MAAERVLTGHMDADKPIWAVVENVTVKLAGCIVYDITIHNNTLTLHLL